MSATRAAPPVAVSTPRSTLPTPRPTPAPRRRRSSAPVVALAAAGVALLVLALRALTAAPEVPGLPDAGPVTQGALVLVDVAVRLLAVACVGALLLRAVLLPAGASTSGTATRAARLAAGAAAGWALAAAAQLLLQVADLLAVPVHRLPARDLVAVLPQLPAARSAALVVLLTLTAAVLVHRARRRVVPLIALAVAGAALVVPQVLSGHASSAPDHTAAVTLLSVHVVVACAWVGGLVALVALARRSPHLPVAASRFSTVALACFVLTAGTGVAGAWVVLGGVEEVLASGGYGLLLAGKAGALLPLGALGWWHRRRTLPALTRGARGAFVRFAGVEVGVLLAATGLAVALAGTAPAVPPAAASAPPVAASPGPAGPGAAPQPGAAPSAPVQGAPEDMSGHDHGELTVGVLVDGTRFHVAGAVAPGQMVTVFNGSDAPATLTAADGAFDVRLDRRTLTTFVAPTEPGEYPFTSTVSPGFADVLVVRAP